MLDQVLQHLAALVSFDTRNPPRRIGVGGIFDYLRAQLPDFRVEVVDHGDGAVSLFAVRSPHLLNAKGATYAQSADWGVEEAEGFIKLFGMSSTLWAEVNR
jgi:acetylornithine deacetylase